jgi:hypothetical protein
MLKLNMESGYFLASLVVLVRGARQTPDFLSKSIRSQNMEIFSQI